MSSDIDDCIPDVPDVGALIDKAKSTLYGKKPNINFTPIDFEIDISNFFDFNMIGKLLGKGGLGMDVCGHTIDGLGFDSMDGGVFIPAQDTIDGLNQSIQDNAQGIADNAANQGGGTP